MYQSLRHTRSTLAFAIATALWLGAPGAFAQTDDDEDDSDLVIEEVVVTGTYIAGLNEEVLPVTVMSDTAIEKLGAVNMQDILSYIPSISDFEFEDTNNGTNGARGDVAGVNMRGLGSGNTLVLMNGRRMVAHPVSQTVNSVPVITYNVNSVPSSAVRRIAVLRDGAAPLYGADAIAGVVNFVPYTTFDGLRLSGRYGWSEATDGRAHLTLYVQNGRIADQPGAAQMTALREIAKIHDGDFRMTANQNIVVANVATDKQSEIERIAREAGLMAPWSGLKRNAMACVALPTCGLALAESERYLPELLDALDEKLSLHRLSADDIVIRMTGCPNGCARPYLAEIGMVGKAPGRYNLHLGAAHNGDRLNRMTHENINETEILETLDGWFGQFADQRAANETFGDFVTRVSGEQ